MSTLLIGREQQYDRRRRCARSWRRPPRHGSASPGTVDRPVAAAVLVSIINIDGSGIIVSKINIDVLSCMHARCMSHKSRHRQPSICLAWSMELASTICTVHRSCLLHFAY